MGDSTGIVRLAPAPTLDASIRKDAVDLLEELLVQAREGRVGQMVVVFEQDDERYESAWTGTRDIARRVGMLEIAKHRVLAGSE